MEKSQPLTHLDLLIISKDNLDQNEFHKINRAHFLIRLKDSAVKLLLLLLPSFLVALVLKQYAELSLTTVTVITLIATLPTIVLLGMLVLGYWNKIFIKLKVKPFQFNEYMSAIDKSSADNLMLKIKSRNYLVKDLSITKMSLWHPNK